MFYYLKVHRIIQDDADYVEYVYFNSEEAMNDYISRFDMHLFRHSMKFIGTGRADFNDAGVLVPLKQAFVPISGQVGGIYAGSTPALSYNPKKIIGGIKNG